MAHKKAGGSSKNGRDSNSKRLGVKRFGGQSVKAGETLLILEAMKMEHAVKAVSDGKISEMYVKTGDQVESGANLLKID